MKSISLQKLLFGTVCFFYFIALPITALTSYGKKVMIYNSDFLPYYAAAKIVLVQGPNAVYNLELHSEIQQKYREGLRLFINLPYTAVPFEPLASLTIEQAFIIFELVNTLLLFYTVWLLGKVFSLSLLKKAIILMFPPIFLVIGLGQISIFLAFPVCAFLYLIKTNKVFLAGLCLALLVLKFQYLLIIPFVFLFIKEKVKFSLGILCTLFVVLVVNVLAFGVEFYNLYLNFMRGVPAYTLYLVRIHGVGLMAFNKYITNIPFLLILDVCAILLFVVYLITQRKKSVESFNKLFFLSVIVAMLTAVYSHAYDFVLLLPVLAYIIEEKYFYKRWFFYAVYFGLTIFAVANVSVVSVILLVLLGVKIFGAKQ